jgi:hypothetical protein
MFQFNRHLSRSRFTVLTNYASNVCRRLQQPELPVISKAVSMYASTSQFLPALLRLLQLSPETLPQSCTKRAGQGFRQFFVGNDALRQFHAAFP